MAKAKKKSGDTTKSTAKVELPGKQTSVGKVSAGTTKKVDKRIKQLERRLEDAVATMESAAKQTQKAAKQMAKQVKLVAELPGKVAHDVRSSNNTGEESLLAPVDEQTVTSPARESTSKTGNKLPAAKQTRATPRKTVEKSASTSATPARAGATTGSTASLSADLASKTRQELLGLARSRDLTGRNAMTKAELVAALS